jgi:hypothetical protein
MAVLGLIWREQSWLADGIYPTLRKVDLLDGVFCFFGVEEGLTFVTTEGDEVKLVGMVEAFEARWHCGSSSLHPTLR